MTVNLSIKNVPDDIADKLRQRASRNHRSLQGELMTILQNATQKEAGLTPREFLAKIREKGLLTPAQSRQIVREERDAH